jgi:hypothetical protein
VDRSELMEQLVEADMAVAEGERLLTRQQNVLRLLRARRYDTTRTEKLLANLTLAQSSMISARQQIRADLKRFRLDPSQMH